MRLLLVLVLVACGNSTPAPTTTGKKPINAADRDTCTVAADCTLVDACCGCNAGGKKVAIRKDAVAEYDAGRQQRCGGQACTMMMSTHASCDAEAGCDNGHCKVLPHMGGAPQ